MPPAHDGDLLALVTRVADKAADKAIACYAASHPRPPHVNQVQAAAMLGVSRPTLCRMVKAGVFKLNACGMIPIGQIDRALE